MERDTSINNSQNRLNQSTLLGLGCVLAVLCTASLILLIIFPNLRIAFYVLYLVTAVTSAACLRFGQVSRACGLTAFSVVASTCLCFCLCGIVGGPEMENPSQGFGSGSMINMFRLLTYPFKFFPLALPALACWILAAIYEKWHVALHVIAVPILSLILIVNMYLLFYAALYQETRDWLLS